MEYLYTGRIKLKSKHDVRKVRYICRELQLSQLEQGIINNQTDERQCILVNHEIHVTRNITTLVQCIISNVNSNELRDLQQQKRQSYLDKIVRATMNASYVTLISQSGHEFFTHRYIICAHSD